MKARIIIFSILALLFGKIEVFAQSVNKLSIPEIEGRLGKELAVPVYMTNDNEIAGIQVNIRFPQGAQVNANSITLSDRKDNHTITARPMGNNDYLFVIFSASNKLIKGNSGILFTVQVNIPTDWEENSTHSISFNQVILSSTQGDNLVTGAEPGSIRIIAEPRPDFTVENIQVNKSSLNPGDKFIASWTVKNIGDAATASGYSEHVLLVGDDGKQTSLGILRQDVIISAGNSVNRQSEFSLSQLPGIDGNVKLSVRIVPDADAGELSGAQGNNTAKSVQYVTVTKKLLLELPQYAIPENHAASIQCKLSRSGNWSEQQVFTLITDNPQRIYLPASVTIPAQQSGAFFYIQVIDNTVLDLDSMVAVTVSGNGYEAVAENIIIEDDELADLSLAASKIEINEGDVFALTVEREHASASELLVYLNCNYPKRFDFPSQITIPAGQKSVSVNITAVDDNIPDMTRDIEFTASAAKHKNGKLNLTLYDNDLPEITLTLTPQTVNESAGPLAVKAVLRRLTKKDGNVTVVLSDNSGGGLYYSSTRLTLAPGVEEAQFTIGVIDNAVVEGDRVIDITASVYISSCSCSVSGTSAGMVQAQLTVLDDDGPALKITSSQTMLQEGKTNATVLTVTRNTSTAQSLTVTISSDHDSELSYAKTVIIPTGSASVDVSVSVLANDISEGDRTVIFTVTANGFTRGSCWVMITDQTLPDAVISLFTVYNTDLQAGGTTTVKAVVTNAGAAELPRVPVSIYLNDASSLLITVNTHKALGINESDTIVQNIAMPDATGNYTVYATVNEKQSVKELLYLNNTSEKIPVSLLPKFTATATTDKTVYKQGEAVIISGQLTGNEIANTAVEVYIIGSGIRQTLDATTDASGHFTVTFQPSVYQSGHFSAGACYPKEGLTAEQASFDIYGAKRADSGYITHDLTVDDPYQGNIRLTNTGTLPLNNVNAEVISEFENGTIVFEPIGSISGNATAALNYTLTGNAPSEGSEWQNIKIRITSNESELMELIIYAYFRSAKGKLEANISSIRTTMTKGSSRDYPLTITNVGKGATGKISLSLPANAAWLSAATPREMASLATNESATIVLRFTPTDDLALNVPVTGTIGINCENGTGLPLSFSVEPVSEYTGTLQIDVCDEYTYYTAEAPHLAGAKVVLKHPVTGAVITEGTTDSAGLFTVNYLPEGYYAIEVSADKHDSYKNNILVDPGKTTRKVVNLSFQAITYNWDVVETEVEDEYEITTTVEYETNVPVPVVVVEFPDKIEYKDQIFNIIVTNKGLIAAKQVAVELPEVTGVVFEILSEHPIASLLPQQSMVIPVKMTVNNEFYWGIPNSDTGGGNTGGGNTGGGNTGGGNTGGGNTGGGNTGSGNTDPNPNNICVEICFGIRWIYECGDDIIVRYEWHCYHYGNCPITGNTITGGPGPGIGGPVGPGGGGYYYGGGGTGNYPTIITDCDSCRYITKQKLIDCGMSFIPVYGCIKGEVDCYKSYNKPNRTWRDNAKCVLTHLGCVAEMAGAKIIGWIANAISCLIDFTECTPTIKSSISLRSSKPSYMEDFGNTIDALLPELEAHKNILLENFGNEVWLDCSNDDITTLINYLLSLDENELIDIDDSNLQNVIPIGISSENFYKFIERLNNTSRRLNGETVNANYIDQDLLDHYFDEILAVENMAKSIGYESSNDMWEKKYAEFLSNLNESSSSVCASISLQFSQTMTMTRQAFRGTLTVFNGHESIPMENVRLDLVVKDKLGNIATSHEFQINNENIQDFGGDLNGSWSLDAQKTGVATVVFIPTKYAAPTEPVEYSFGGSLSYIDPFTGLEVIRDLNPVTLTVKPSPNLDLTYFMQRDILGDDPLTPEIEPLVPAEFSLIIHNVGVGEATNIRMVTQQPKIVDNQKGLFIDFELLSSQLNGGEHTLALGGSLPSDFGNIPSGKTAYAQWWFTGSLLGHFINYDVQATHVTSYGNPDLTLLNDVSIHELIRSINANDADNSLLTGFMVNDIPDAEDLPDMLYLSDGTVETVSHAGNMVCVSEGNNQYRLTVTPSAIGWNYGAVNDPTGGRQQLIEIKRVSDNAVIDLRNCWQTDRTLRDGKDPLYENRLHIVDKFVNGQQYMLTFTPAPDVFLEVESFEGTPEGVSSTAVQEITVRFNKNIDATTFTVTDIRLICQGENIDTDLISITPVNERTFKLGLSAVTQRDGYYVLTVQTSGITDSEGYQGKIGKTTDWNQYSGGKMQFNLKIEPENGGTVTPPAGKYDYSSTLNLLAVPNEGYLFEKWSINGETLSTEPAYSFTLLSDKTLKAAFKLKLYDVTVNCDKNAGRIVGSGSGKYEHGSHLSLKAEPFAGYLFAGWTVNGNSNTDNMLDITVDSDKIIEALFTKHIIITTDTTNISTNICQGEIYDFFGTGLTESGSYEYILQNVSGGDSIIVLNLTVNPYPAVPTVTVEGTHTLVSSALNNNQWYDENGAIEGATDQSFIPTVSGVYHVTNSNGNCESEASESYYVNLSNEIKIDWDLVPKWNWVSINSMQATPVESLLAPVKSKIEQIVGYNSEAIVSESGFTGNLTVMTAKESYKFKLNSQAVMTLTGAVSPTTEVTVQLIAGWNWIGYLPVVNLTTANALAGLSPSVNDVVKNQTDFSVYDGQKWTGSLKEMKQGDGYMYFSATAKTFTWSSLRAAKVESSTLRSSATPIWEYDAHKYRDNMNIVAQLSVNGQIPAEGIYTVGAFQGNECRGIGKYANGRLFITVHGEIAGETVTFKAYENATGKEYGIEETLPFADALKGTFAQPVTLSIKGLSMPENFETPSFIIYPNPVKGSLYISGSNLSAIKAIKILTVTGSVVLATDNYDKGQGIDAGSLPNGSYILAICLDDNVIYRKFVKFR